MRCLAILAAAALACTTASAFGSDAGETIYTNKTRFRIPFRYDHTEMQRLGAREVQLFVSTDQGRNWQLAQRVVPMAGRFDFSAPADGEYWFCVRTLDARNELHPPAEAVRPGLRVVVDTTPPRLELTLQQIAADRVELSWKCEDAHLDLSQLTMEYIQTGDTAWSGVRVVPQASGRTAWSMPRGGQVAVRGSIRDRASNESRTQNQIELTPAVIPGPSGTRTPVRTPAEPPRIPDLNEPIAEQNVRDAPPPISPAGQFIRDDAASRPPILRDAEPPVPKPATATAPAPAPAPVAAIHRPVEAPRRMVNALGFQIDYSVEGVGASGVGAVELFITENNGQKWFKYGDDEDCQSPIQVRVPQDGTYGFAIRVRSGVGLSDPPPRPGERPELVVVVDTTPPAVELLPIRQVRGADAHRIEIAWRVSDAHPAESPILLSYAAERDGEWQNIGDWQPDSGRYVWTADARLAPKAYIRVTARDAAGNHSTAESPEAIVLETTRPSVRIMDVQPTR
ncbi:MAG TPA: hypothetical protein VML55_17200 [Planctomycetaceae bacterium]|nr:hypothetical protein [Planctomycetaceae bacterium]